MLIGFFLLLYICLTNVFFLSCFPFTPFCLYLLWYLLFPNNSSPVFMVYVEVWSVQHPCSAYDRKYAVFVTLGLAYFINVTASDSVFLPIAYFISSLRLNKTPKYILLYNIHSILFIHPVPDTWAVVNEAVVGLGEKVLPCA